MKKLWLLLLALLPLLSRAQTKAVLVLSDVHVDLNPNILNAKYEDADTALFISTLKSVGPQKFPFIIMPGDLMPHGDNHDSATMKKTLGYVIERVHKLDTGAVILPALGNNDCMEHNKPDAQTYKIFYNAVLKRIDKNGVIHKSFKVGGYYAYNKGDLSVIVLNTDIFAEFLSGQETAANEELHWLDTTLADAVHKGKNVWIVCHIPPGFDRHEKKGSWNNTYQDRYLKMIKNYAAIIKFQLAGHTHLNDYRLITDQGTLISYIDIAPGLNTRNGNNPAYQVVYYNEPDKVVNEVKTYWTNSSNSAWHSFSFTDFNFNFLLHYKKDNAEGRDFIKHYYTNKRTDDVFDFDFCSKSIIKVD